MVLTLLVLAAISLVAVPIVPALGAQPRSSEDEIRRLEQLEVRAIIARDTDTFRPLWDETYVVNNPDNVVVRRNPTRPIGPSCRRRASR